jgi:5-methylcytosine-specific restriction enzyme A
MSPSRKRAWLRDELILALDLYARERPHGTLASREALSRTLRAFPIEPELANEPGFRSEAAVARKLANFLAIETNFAEGLPHISTGDVAVWQEFADDHSRLSEIAAGIRANVDDGGELNVGDEDGWEAAEGELLTRIHRRRERNRALVARKKAAVLTATGHLACEACGFPSMNATAPAAKGSSSVTTSWRCPPCGRDSERVFQTSPLFAPTAIG